MAGDGTTCAKPQGGDRRSHRIEAYRDAILATIEKQTDITLVEMAEMLRVSCHPLCPPTREISDSPVPADRATL